MWVRLLNRLIFTRLQDQTDHQTLAKQSCSLSSASSHHFWIERVTGTCCSIFFPPLDLWKEQAMCKHRQQNDYERVTVNHQCMPNSCGIKHWCLGWEFWCVDCLWVCKQVWYELYHGSMQMNVILNTIHWERMKDFILDFLFSLILNTALLRKSLQVNMCTCQTYLIWMAMACVHHNSVKHVRQKSKGTVFGI